MSLSYRPAIAHPMSYLHATILRLESIAWVIACLLCAIAGFVLSYLWSRSEVTSAREQWLRAGVQAAELEREAATLRSQLLELAQRSAAFEERARMMGNTKQALENAFKSLSADALKDNNAAFLNLAKASLGEFQQVAKGDLERRQQAIDALVGPVKESLEKVDQKIHALERVREQAYGEIRQQFDSTPECVVMFIPGEAFCSAALEADPELLDNAFGMNVIIASPASLMALLKAAAFGWRQESIAENARAISQLGQELHKRIGDVASRMERLGRALESAAGAYNEAIGSFESRLSVSARRFRDLGATSQDANIVELRAIEGGLRRLQSTGDNTE